MKHSFKPVALCLFAALGLMIQGCGPETKITGTVLDDQTGTTVPGAAVLGMVWIEDADKALPVPDTKNLKSEDRDIALDKDTTDRGLPVAYARTFADSNGRFELADFHFSADTKKAVKAMKQPKITRVTVWAFQKGYRKQAVTMFPKTGMKELPSPTMLLVRPTNWKDLYVENTVNSLTEKYMLKGYSKEFGATKAEKSWIFEYTRANEQLAYDTSDIKGDKKMEEMCGHDYSDVIISTAGIWRNPEREKCGELLKRIGSIREVEELWLAHSNIKQDPLAAAKEVVGRALNAIASETVEPKEYEARIFEGLKNAVDTQSREDMRNGVSDTAWQDEAKLLYGKGDKAAAYRALGYALYKQLPGEIQQGVLTAQLALITVPGIKDTAAGFYRLMTRPLTAQLPGGDGGNHKDKSAYKTEVSTETVEVEVKDYKSFQTYIAREEAKLTVKPVTNETGKIKKVLKDKGIELSSTSVWAKSRDDWRHVYQSPDNKGASVIDDKTGKIEIYKANGERVRAISFAKYPDGIIAFSDNRLFVIKGGVGGISGFEIYDFSGKLVKNLEGDLVHGYMISNNKRYFSVTAGSPKSGKYFAVYDMDGKELWRKEIVAAGGSLIQFSLDDRFVIVKIPAYWFGDKQKILRHRKLYLFDMENRKLISEEVYEK